MALTTIPQSVNDLAAALEQSLRAGQGTRQQLGDTGKAAGWTTGLPPTLVDYVAATAVSGLSFDVVIVKASGTPAGIVGEGQPKPKAVSFSPANVPLAKHAGYGEFSLEQMLTADALASVVYSVIAGQVLTSFEATAIDAIEGTTGTVAAAGATLVAAILDGQSKVLGNGGRPGVLVISPADYAALMGGTVGGYGGSQNPDNGPVGALFGMAVHVSAGATTGAPLVLDPAAVTVGVNEHTPMVTLDPFSQSTNNLVRIVVDLLAATVVTSPGAVAECTVTPA